ncbi:hypothetical protein pb186bvf_014705 [Paramecium bursaria]
MIDQIFLKFQQYQIYLILKEFKCSILTVRRVKSILLRNQIFRLWIKIQQGQCNQKRVIDIFQTYMYNTIFQYGIQRGSIQSSYYFLFNISTKPDSTIFVNNIGKLSGQKYITICINLLIIRSRNLNFETRIFRYFKYKQSNIKKQLYGQHKPF